MEVVPRDDSVSLGTFGVEIRNLDLQLEEKYLEGKIVTKKNMKQSSSLSFQLENSAFKVMNLIGQAHGHRGAKGAQRLNRESVFFLG